MSDVYQNPLITRYASKQMSAIFSSDEKIKCWRKLWLSLAEAEQELGLNITDEQIAELKANVNNLNLDVSAEREREVRHDVMAQIYAYSVQCPKAAGIIHLGATSCFVGDNADLIAFYKAFELVRNKTIGVMAKLKAFALKYKSLPTLGFTHLQSAQLVTVGKRATLWLQDLVMDFNNIEFILENYKLRGVKGTTGTQASFMQLFNNDYSKVKMLDKIVSQKMGFKGYFAVGGQTYPRKIDYSILAVLSGIAQSASKAANDIRILQNMKEIEEPFEKTQIGSSAMAYKRNPMRCERIVSLAKYVESLPINAAMTASNQWLERTLDDSANRRIVMAEAFLAIDAILEIYMNVSENLVVYERVINKHIMDELPFMATENILMECVKLGGNRQDLHERIRVHSMEAAKQVKQEGNENDLLERIATDPAFFPIHDMLEQLILPENFIGAAPIQVEEFIKDEINPILSKHKDAARLVGNVII
ncbi:MAG: adenylosuccinate lyase [Clostridia bacterium]